MKKYYKSLAAILLAIALHAQAFAGTGDKEMDMSVYANWAAYGFLIMLALTFAYFLPRLAFNYEIQRPAAPKRNVTQGTASATILGEVIGQLRLVYYSVISLILLQLSIFMLLVIF